MAEACLACLNAVKRHCSDAHYVTECNLYLQVSQHHKFTKTTIHTVRSRPMLIIIKIYYHQLPIRSVKCASVTCSWRGPVHQETHAAAFRRSCTWWRFARTCSLQTGCCNRLHSRVFCPSLQQHELPPTWQQRAVAECSRLSSHWQCSPTNTQSQPRQLQPATEMTYIVAGGALNSTHLRKLQQKEFLGVP